MGNFYAVLEIQKLHGLAAVHSMERHNMRE